MSEQTVSERLAEIDKVLDGYEEQRGLKPSIAKQKVSDYLDLSEDQLDKFTASECGNAAYMLSGFALHIQREINKEVSRVTWADTNLSILLADKLSKYHGVSYEERKNQAIKDNDYAMKLYKIKVYAQQRADRLSYLPSRIEYVASKLTDSQKRKSYEERKEQTNS